MVKGSSPRQILVNLLTRQGQGKTRRMRRGLTAQEVKAAIEVVSWSCPDTDWGDARATAKACWTAVSKAGRVKPAPPADYWMDEYAWDLIVLYNYLADVATSRNATLGALGLKPFDPTLDPMEGKIKEQHISNRRRRPLRKPPPTPEEIARQLERCEKCKKIPIWLFQSGYQKKCPLRDVEGSGCYGVLLGGRTPTAVAEEEARTRGKFRITSKDKPIPLYRELRWWTK
jgi:hypothetical protein